MYARSFPTIMTTMRVPQKGCCCHQPPLKIVPVVDDVATNSKRNNLFRGCGEDLVYAFAASADIAGVDVKIRSDIAFSVAVVSQQSNDEKKIRAYVERAVELNPDNMDAKEAHVMHRTAIHNVGVYTSTNVTTTATATASASANAYSSATINRQSSMFYYQLTALMHLFYSSSSSVRIILYDRNYFVDYYQSVSV